MTVRFDDRVAIVTGAGAGLGRSHAMLLASRGAKVVVNDPGGSVDGSGGANAVADKVVAEIKAAGGEAVASYASVAEEKTAQSIIDTAMNAWGRLDILVNNAGILRDKSFNNLDMPDYEFVNQVHHFRHRLLHQGRLADHAKTAIRPHRRDDLRFGNGREFRPSQLRGREDGGERTDQRAASRGGEIQHPPQRDLALGADPDDGVAAAARHRPPG